MAVSTFIIFPEPLVAGDSWAFEMQMQSPWDETYSATLSFAAYTNKLTANAWLDDQVFRWLIPGTETGKLPGSPYSYQLSVTDPLGNRYTIDTGAVTVVADISAAGTNVDSQTMLQKQLAKCDETLLVILGKQTQIARFQGQEYTLHNVKELWEVRVDLASRVADEQDALRGSLRGRQFITRFVCR
jgi:hypothetical protein